MFVVTEKNPRYAKQKKLIDSMIGTSKKLFPGLLDSREIYTYQYRVWVFIIRIKVIMLCY